MSIKFNPFTGTFQWFESGGSPFGTDLLPDTDNTYNLGSATYTWKYLYLSNRIYSPNYFIVNVNSVDRFKINSAGSTMLGPDTTCDFSATNTGVTVKGSNLRPTVDNTTDLGQLSYRWTVVYAVNGTIQTSDERFKKDIKDLPAALIKAVSKLQPREFVWKEKENGKHIGFIAQEVNAVFKGAEIDPKEYFIVQSDEYYSLVYTEFIALITAYAQSLERRIEAIEEHIGL